MTIYKAHTTRNVGLPNDKDFDKFYLVEKTAIKKFRNFFSSCSISFEVVTTDVTFVNWKEVTND